MKNVQIILLNNEVSNIYFNTGYYATKVLEDMKNQGISNLELIEFHTDKSTDEIIKFLKK